MKIQLIRHATLVVEMNGTRILVDPMLGAAGNAPPIANSTNQRRNPLVELPFPVEQLFPVDSV